MQAFLVNRLAEPHQYYMAPIDKCFELVGTVRLYWKGFTGGTEVWKQVANLFARLKATAECGPRSGMPDLRFSVDAIKVASSAAVPTLLFRLRIENSTPEERIHSILLRCQVQIQVARRSYTAEEKENLYESSTGPSVGARL